MRVFLALPLFPLFASELEDFFSSHRSDFRLKWTSVFHVHVTLHFFGQVSADQLADIFTAAHQTASRFKKIPLSLTAPGVFPNAETAKILWLGVSASQDLAALQAELENALKKYGFPCEDRAFRPHATVGRYKIPGPFFAEDYAFSPTSVRFAESICLYESRPAPGGSIYTILESFPLAPA